jgi:hypothetical protein
VKDVSHHIIGRAIDKLESSRVDFMSDKVIADVDVFGPRVKVVGGGECECRLVVAVEGGRVLMGPNSSLMSRRSQMPSFAACVAATYSASAVDRVTSSCLRERQETAPPSMRMRSLIWPADGLAIDPSASV